MTSLTEGENSAFSIPGTKLVQDAWDGRDTAHLASVERFNTRVTRTYAFRNHDNDSAGDVLNWLLTTYVQLTDVRFKTYAHCILDRSTMLGLNILPAVSPRTYREIGHENSLAAVPTRHQALNDTKIMDGPGKIVRTGVTGGVEDHPSTAPCEILSYSFMLQFALMYFWCTIVY
ncbi:hypothetical protein CERSUDRAFT_94440 [Gelatoporia subvermispora B]|uniref:Uncharacterized protein n=1 Tax=Ceriporiopsis subvermispora (strain B) TaxID=914234 RepID=M2QZ59_CERS8|nr:hypothetical protein CERSUDRAFT_94440 [Gelatoporia subvermispora B]